MSGQWFLVDWVANAPTVVECNSCGRSTDVIAANWPAKSTGQIACLTNCPECGPCSVFVLAEAHESVPATADIKAS